MVDEAVREAEERADEVAAELVVGVVWVVVVGAAGVEVVDGAADVVLGAADDTLVVVGAATWTEEWDQVLALSGQRKAQARVLTCSLTPPSPATLHDSHPCSSPTSRTMTHHSMLGLPTLMSTRRRTGTRSPRRRPPPGRPSARARP